MKSESKIEMNLKNVIVILSSAGIVCIVFFGIIFVFTRFIPRYENLSDHDERIVLNELKSFICDSEVIDYQYTSLQCEPFFHDKKYHTKATVTIKTENGETITKNFYDCPSDLYRQSSDNHWHITVNETNYTVYRPLTYTSK